MEHCDIWVVFMKGKFPLWEVCWKSHPRKCNNDLHYLIAGLLLGIFMKLSAVIEDFRIGLPF